MKYILLLPFLFFTNNPDSELPDVWFSVKDEVDVQNMEFTFNKELYTEEQALQLMQEFIDIRMKKLGYEKI